ncbi:GNAT family N-acetyltransferase [Pseudoxanthomonas sacheonensis]|uniref:GNAT family N-acetyltransferase n=1 Tax=Pseudoxanthomonas sacheonensis TaxID=443615 RepID=UPI0013D817A6|nr:GNAT family N-acetyltransferase [Pseudoxanthomonas sacheonensis]KAF1707155.1 GNAT family N-acetyltransferase [Pseudoxanthomonas sacheonensis]
MDSPHTIGLFRGPEILPWLEDAARLRISVFREWPYLYDGNFEYERDYLAAYAQSKESLLVLALDGDEVVGASTGMPLADSEPAFRQPFVEQGMPVGSVFYFGESVLLSAYRGRGIGHAFFDSREAHARALGRFRWTAFCSVDRDAADTRRPDGYRPNDAFWSNRGYQSRPGMAMRLPWQEAGRGEVDHSLTFWLRELEQAA